MFIILQYANIANICNFATMEKKVLYIHGMGGGGDSRIPSILKPLIEGAELVVRTYDFDPEKAALQISSWVSELNPSLIIGESLGSLHAIRIKGLPHILISPSLNAPLYLGWLCWLALVPGVTWLLDHIYMPKPGDRQSLHFKYEVLKKYRAHRKAALANSTRSGSNDLFFAFFGRNDHYRKSGVVSVRTWKRYFGDTYELYDGSHFMEEEHIRARLVPFITNVLNDNK